jgi:signal transduction histidine kinase/HAMP domain-containing protein
MLGIIIYSVSQDAGDALEAQIRARLALTVKNISNAIEDDLSGKWSAVQNMSVNSLIANSLIDVLGRDAYLTPLLKNFSMPGKSTGKAYICLLDYKGRMVGQNIEGAKRYDKAPWLGKVLEGAPHAEIMHLKEGHAVLFAFPVYYQKYVEGVLVSEFSVDFAEEIAAQEKEFKASLLNAHRDLLLGSLTETVIEQILSAQRILHEASIFEREDELYGVFHLDTIDVLQNEALSLVFSIPKGTILAPVKVMRRRMIRIGLFTAFCLSLLIIWRSGAFVRPLHRLQDTMSTIIEEGDLSKRVIVTSRDEVGSLGETFNNMMHILHQKDMELKVENAERRRAEEELRESRNQLIFKNREIDESRAQLQEALDKVLSLIQQVARKRDFSVRFFNPNLGKCCETMGCDKTDCVCYGKDEVRCWQMAGTFCGGRVQGMFIDKFSNCAFCPVFKNATSDPIYQIGEYFNNMMHILELQHRELTDAYGELQLVQSQIIQQEKMASIGQLAAGVAHEINNPMGFIMSNLGTLRKYVERLTEFIRVQEESIGLLMGDAGKLAGDNETGEVGKAVDKGALEKILNERKRSLKIGPITRDLEDLVKESLEGAERVKKIVQNLKNFSRIDETEYKLADINSGIESTLNIVWNELKYKATVKREYGDLPTTMCNLGQLNQVFMNMLVNAAHSINQQGEITVRTWHGAGAIHVSITDTGSGIPDSVMGRIFDPFFTTKEVGKGTGLGLSIAYDIVKKHNGDIAVASEIGKGTTFTVTIPVVGG